MSCRAETRVERNESRVGDTVDQESGEPIQESLHRKILKQFLIRAALRARFNITQALAVSELRESHAQELVPAGEAARPTVAMVAGHAAAKLAVGQVGNKLREHRAAKVHASWCTSRRSNRGKRKPPQVAVLQLVAHTPLRVLAGH